MCPERPESVSDSAGVTTASCRPAEKGLLYHVSAAPWLYPSTFQGLPPCRGPPSNAFGLLWVPAPCTAPRRTNPNISAVLNCHQGQQPMTGWERWKLAFSGRACRGKRMVLSFFFSDCHSEGSEFHYKYFDTSNQKNISSLAYELAV